LVTENQCDHKIVVFYYRILAPVCVCVRARARVQVSDKERQIKRMGEEGEAQKTERVEGGSERLNDGACEKHGLGIYIHICVCVCLCVCVCV
jgi:hypothetical protein